MARLCLQAKKQNHHWLRPHGSSNCPSSHFIDNYRDGWRSPPTEEAVKLQDTEHHCGVFLGTPNATDLQCCGVALINSFSRKSISQTCREKSNHSNLTTSPRAPPKKQPTPKEVQQYTGQKTWKIKRSKRSKEKINTGCPVHPGPSRPSRHWKQDILHFFIRTIL